MLSALTLQPNQFLPQVDCYLPELYAEASIVNAIMVRLGSADNLGCRGRSILIVEISATARSG